MNPADSIWTWVSGTQIPSSDTTLSGIQGTPNAYWLTGTTPSAAAGSYGTRGVASVANEPDARNGAATWTDAAGHFWLFGGSNLNDLWTYDPATGDWTWVSGSNTSGAGGVYGTQGIAAAGNIPPARTQASSWIDSAGHLWLFGGSAAVTTASGTGEIFRLNDLWEFSPSTGKWTWVSGFDLANASGIYNTPGQPSSFIVPGARQGAASWSDASGNFWLFGGFGFDADGTQGFLNDLWMFNPTSGQWTFVSGATQATESGEDTSGGILEGGGGIDGMLGIPATTNLPAARTLAAAWKDSAGNFWLFGGYGIYPTYPFAPALLDTWTYSPTTNEWTWMGGLPQGTIPDPGANAMVWTDISGHVWLLGGFSVTSPGGIYTGVGAALWEYSP